MVAIIIIITAAILYTKLPWITMYSLTHGRRSVSVYFLVDAWLA